MHLTQKSGHSNGTVRQTHEDEPRYACGESHFMPRDPPLLTFCRVVACQLVDVRRFVKLTSRAAQVSPAEVVGEYEDNVGSDSWFIGGPEEKQVGPRNWNPRAHAHL